MTFFTEKKKQKKLKFHMEVRKIPNSHSNPATLSKKEQCWIIAIPHHKLYIEGDFIKDCKVLAKSREIDQWNTLPRNKPMQP
jgi:hypothetical protein